MPFLRRAVPGIPGLATLLLTFAVGCAPAEAEGTEDETSEARFDGLSADEAEVAARAFLAQHDARGTDFERREGERPPSAASALGTRELRAASVAEDMQGLAATKGEWAYRLSVVSREGTLRELAAVDPGRPMMGASTFKLFTGWTAFSNASAGNATLTTMLSASDNRLANLVMCRNGEVLGRWDAKCVARETPTPAMRMPDAVGATRTWLGEHGVTTGSSFAMFDGAGLVEEGTLTVDDLSRLLLHVHAHPRGKAFREMMAQPGVASTLRGRFRGLEGRLWGKTGTYHDFGGGVKALAGYATLSGDRTLVFAIVGNRVGNPDVAMRAIETTPTSAITHADAE